VRASDVDDDSVRIETLGDEGGVHHEGCSMQALRRAKNLAAEGMSDHDVMADRDGEHGNLAQVEAGKAAG
jgi:hypothetical protein